MLSHTCVYFHCMKAEIEGIWHSGFILLCAWDCIMPYSINFNREGKKPVLVLVPQWIFLMHFLYLITFWGFCLQKKCLCFFLGFFSAPKTHCVTVLGLISLLSNWCPGLDYSNVLYLQVLESFWAAVEDKVALWVFFDLDVWFHCTGHHSVPWVIIKKEGIAPGNALLLVLSYISGCC